MPEIKIVSEDRVNPQSTYLTKFRNNITSQTGEDGLIEEIFNIMGASNQSCVEFGAWDGKKHSNSWNLINHKNWGGLLIEGDKERYKELLEAYSDNPSITALNAFISTKGDDSLDSILSQTSIPTDFDLLSIDIDGCDWHVWKHLSVYRPRLVVIEFNPTIPNNIYFVQDDDTQINQGASLRACIELGKKKGYELVASLPWNAFFVRIEDYSKFNIEDNSIDAMHNPGEMESQLFQLFDGTVVLTGCSTLLWHRIPISQEDIQILPEALRKFPG